MADGAIGKPIHSIPFPPNRSFVGRSVELDLLAQKLMVNRTCYQVSIVGLRGTGKTQVALQFAYMVKESSPNISIFWLPVLSMESFEQACAKVVKYLTIPQVGNGEDNMKEQFKRYMDTTQAGKWLLVVDNTDDTQILFGTERAKGIVDYLSYSEEGVVLFTTRTLEVANSLTRSDVVELGPMNQQDASDLLEKSLIKKDLLSNSASVDTLLDQLTRLALAIVQAAAYLNKTRIPIARYLQLLQSTEQGVIDLMSREFRDDTRYDGSANAVTTTWVVSFDRIRERDEVAADLLMFISCIEWKAIPRFILQSMQSEVRMGDAVSTLCGYSFATRRGDEEDYDVHRLVHLTTQYWVRQYGDAREVAYKSIGNLAGVLPSADYVNQALWRTYPPHALRLLGDKQNREFNKKSKLFLLVGQCLGVDGRIPEAVRWLEESCNQRQGLDERDSGRLISQLFLAVAYRKNGRIQKAVKLLESVVAIQADVLAEDDLDRLASQHELAMAYQANGQVQEAVKLMEVIVAMQAEVLAEDHPNRLTSQHSLSRAYLENGQIKEAVKLLEVVVAIRTKVLAEDHSDRLSSQHVLAMAYLANGQIQKAIKLLECVVAIRAKALAEDHIPIDWRRSTSSPEHT